MTEPSAWAKAQAEEAENACGMTDDYSGEWCAKHVALALDAAWRAGAEATRKRDLAFFYGTSGKPHVEDWLAVPLPAPGEER